MASVSVFIPAKDCETVLEFGSKCAARACRSALFLRLPRLFVYTLVCANFWYCVCHDDLPIQRATTLRTFFFWLMIWKFIFIKCDILRELATSELYFVSKISRWPQAVSKLLWITKNLVALKVMEWNLPNRLTKLAVLQKEAAKWKNVPLENVLLRQLQYTGLWQDNTYQVFPIYQGQREYMFCDLLLWTKLVYWQV